MMPTMHQRLNDLRVALEEWMIETDDPMLESFQKRDDPTVREAWVAAQEAEAESRRRNNQRQADE